MTETQTSLLLVDDDPAFNRILCRTLAQRGYFVSAAHGPDEALAIAATRKPARIILDLNLGGHSGLTLIKPLLAILPNARILVLTGYASIATAVEAIKLGASQYLAKPTDADAITRALEAPDITESPPPPQDPMSVERLEWEHIQRVLADQEGNISATARALKMHRRTLQRKLAKRPVKA